MSRNCVVFSLGHGALKKLLRLKSTMNQGSLGISSPSYTVAGRTSPLGGRRAGQTKHWIVPVSPFFL